MLYKLIKTFFPKTFWQIYFEGERQGNKFFQKYSPASFELIDERKPKYKLPIAKKVVPNDSQPPAMMVH